jgi:SsrA-binding protein
MAKTKKSNGKNLGHGTEQAGGDRLIAQNRRARFNYDIIETLEAGISLTGTEIKSVRSGRVSLQEAFARIQDGEVWVHGLHIAPYAQGNIYNHDPTRPRKLLLHAEQIEDLEREIKTGSLTLVPLRMYITRHRAKLQIALARGRKQFDKRHAIARRDVDREMQRAMGSRG